MRDSVSACRVVASLGAARHRRAGRHRPGDRVLQLEPGSLLHHARCKPTSPRSTRGQFKGWARTGRSFEAYRPATPGASPVCRFYIPPAQGDSHFYSASPTECAQTKAMFPTFVEESTGGDVHRPAGCHDGRVPGGRHPGLSRVGQPRDSNHRYTVDRQLRQAMVAQGWIAEGYGPDQVIMCAPNSTPPSAVAPPCTGTNPHVAVPGRAARHVRVESESSRGRLPDSARQRRDRQGPDAVRREPRHLLVRRRAAKGRVRLDRGDDGREALHRCRAHGEPALLRSDGRRR